MFKRFKPKRIYDTIDGSKIKVKTEGIHIVLDVEGQNGEKASAVITNPKKLAAFLMEASEEVSYNFNLLSNK